MTNLDLPKQQKAIETGKQMSVKTEKFTFQNSIGETLIGSLELPAGTPKATALFAHCFTCNKNVLAASRISRAMRDHGFAVLRFDFTGLGQSEGDFANTNFSTNVEDLRNAIGALRDRGIPPRILIGHSLGGAAVLQLAGEIEEVALVATVGAPSEPAHVAHLIDEQAARTIAETGEAEVNLGSQPFTIKKQFLDDINEASLKQKLSRLRKPVLIFHSPTDAIVGIDQARKIYQAASHPKSFVSLDGADHLLRNKADAQFVANVISTWAARYLELEEDSDPPAFTPPIAGSVVVTERNGSFTHDVFTENHALIADEPTSVGGRDLGMTPYDLLLAALGACTSMTLRMYAKRKGLSLNSVSVTLQHDRIHADDCETCEQQTTKIDRVKRLIKIDGDLTAAQRTRLLEIADMCPVHRTLMNQKQIVTEEDDA